jgi:adenylate cyclase
MTAKLVIRTVGDSEARTVELKDYNTIGRASSASIQLVDRQVSKQHATILQRGSDFLVQDAGSRNGTVVNGERIPGEHVLKVGDEIRLGNSRLLFSNPTANVEVEVAASTGANIHMRVIPQPGMGPGFAAAKELGTEAEVRAAYDRLRLGHALQKELAALTGEEELLDRIFEFVFDNIKVERGVYFEYVEGKGLQPRTVWPKTSESAEGIRMSQTILDRVEAERQPILIHDAQSDQRFDSAQSVILQGLRSALCVPLVVDDRLIGAIHIENSLAAGVLDDQHASLFDAIARTAALALDNRRLAEARQSEEIMRRQLQRVLSPNLVERVINGELAIERGGEVRSASVLFTDIRGFTEITEGEDATDVVALLNEYFHGMVEVVFEQEGTLDKFLGDGVMAVWGAPVGGKEDTWRAVAAGIAMQKVIVEMNNGRVADGLDPIGVGIGIDSGEIVAGYMGSERTMRYTVVGMPVNRAARLCSSAAAGEVLISETVMDEVRERVAYEELAPLDLKGISGSVRCYNVTGER